jgi:iron complex transport system ATP-binding protein
VTTGTPRGRRELAAHDLHLAYDGDTVVSGLDLTVPDGKITAIVGPNACGKSTLLRGIARIMRPAAGLVTLDGRDIHRLPTRQVATVVGLLPQQPIAPDGISVTDLVSRGRYPHHGWLRPWSTEDDRIVAEALAATSTLDLAHRRVDHLSGGQRQRVWLAMALAQATDVLLLDEPTTFLDVTHQLEVLDLLTELNRTRATTVVMVLHDLNLAARYADELIVMTAGRIVASGTPSTVLTPETVQEAFGLAARVVADPVCGAPMVVPIGRFHGAAEHG